MSRHDTYEISYDALLSCKEEISTFAHTSSSTSADRAQDRHRVSGCVGV